jgi:hypothetical protein
MDSVLSKILISFLFLLICPSGFSQTNYGSDGIIFAKQVMGKHLSSINDSLFCAEGTNALYSPASKTRCKSFMVKRINGKQSSIANIVLAYTFVFTNMNMNDSSGIIEEVSFMKSYSKNIMVDYQEKFSDDYKTILQYLVKLFGKKGKTGDVYKEKKYTQHNLVWIHEGKKYILTKDIQENFLVISFYVQPPK